LTFESEVKLREHLRNDSKDICEVVKPPLKAPDGYNDAQEKDLRARTGAEKTDIEKWKDMWVILFPDDSECDIVDPREFGVVSL
jgi:hypothetical protein